MKPTLSVVRVEVHRRPGRIPLATVLALSLLVRGVALGAPPARIGLWERMISGVRTIASLHTVPTPRPGATDLPEDLSLGSRARPSARFIPAPIGASDHSKAPVVVELQTDAGLQLLRGADHRLRYPAFARAFQPQRRLLGCWSASICVVDALLRAGAATPASVAHDPAIQQAIEHRERRLARRFKHSLLGLSLDELSAFARDKLKYSVRTVHAEDLPMTDGEARFRRDLVEVLKRRDRAVIVNFLGRALGLTTGGHHSPIAAYDSRSDRVLVLDVASHKNAPFWAPVADLFHAMRLPDGLRSRGYLVVTR